MAKKRKQKRSSRRRSVSGIGNPSAMLMNVAAIAAGAFAANLISKGIGDKLSPKMVSAAQIVAGALILPRFIKSEMGKSIGSGLVAVGAVSLLQNFGVLKGIGAYDDTVTFAINGTDDLQLIGEDGSIANLDETDEDNLDGMGDLSLIAGFNE